MEWCWNLSIGFSLFFFLLEPPKALDEDETEFLETVAKVSPLLCSKFYTPQDVKSTDELCCCFTYELEADFKESLVLMLICSTLQHKREQELQLANEEAQQLLSFQVLSILSQQI